MQMYSIHTAHTLFAYVTLQQPVQKIKLFVLCLNGQLLAAAGIAYVACQSRTQFDWCSSRNQFKRTQRGEMVIRIWNRYI